MENRRKQQRSYSMNLSQEIIRLIARCFENDADDLRNFRGTCKTWWLSTSMSALLPYKINHSSHQKLISSAVCLLRPHNAAASTVPWMVAIVEPTKGVTQFRHPFSGSLITSLPPNLDLSKFKSSQLAVAYHITCDDENDDDNSDGREDSDDSSQTLCEYDKVLFSSTKSVPTINECMLLGLHDGGQLSAYSCFEDEDEDDDEVELPWIEVSHGTVKRFDDVIMHKGMLCAVDRQGKVHIIDHKEDFDVVQTLVDPPKKRARGSWRKRLVGSPAGRLYLIVRETEKMLKVYKLHEGKGAMWTEVKSLKDKVLFVARNYCFVAAASNISDDLKNCVVFSRDAFPRYARNRWQMIHSFTVEEDIVVFRLGGKYGYKHISTFKGFPLELWSPPSWLYNTSSSQRVEDEEVHVDDNNQVSDVEVHTHDLGHHSDEEMRRDDNWQDCEQMQRDNDDWQDCEQMQRDNDNQEHAPLFNHEISMRHDSTVKFQGVDIRSDLAPILHKIWFKHGNILEGSRVRSKNALAFALETLAESLSSLEGSSLRTLNKSQYEDISSNLNHLKQFNLRIEWLNPILEKFDAFLESRHLIDHVEEFDKQIVQAKTMIIRCRKELQDMKDLEKELNKHREVSWANIPSIVRQNLDQCIINGLI